MKHMKACLGILGLAVLIVPALSLETDADHDGLPDGWESGYPCLSIAVDDSAGDPDGDGNSNLNEYYAQTDPCNKDPNGAAGTGYFGDADGDLIIGSTDLSKINLKLNGRSVDYSSVFPADPVIQDMDGDLIIGSTDKSIISTILNGKRDYVSGSPTELTLVEPATVPAVLVGDTVALVVELTRNSSTPRPGFGVVFQVTSGSAELFGGRGAAPGQGIGARYDLTGTDGRARMVASVQGGGMIRVQVILPGDPKMNRSELALAAPVEILGCADADGDDYFAEEGCGTEVDCNDQKPAIYPYATEIFRNGVDENCNGLADDCPDYDADGYDICGPSDPYNPDGRKRDCNDWNPFIHPGAPETLCDYQDSNCSGYDNDCVCTMDINPACGIDGQTYNNACEAWCFYCVPVACDGPCPCW